MKIAIRYYSKTGNTKKLADTIGAALKVEVQDVSVPLTEDTDILFLGSSVYAAGVDQQIKDFIQNINVKVEKIVNFSTAALLPSNYPQIKKLLAAKGFVISEDEFHCRGSFQMLHRGKPDVEDLKKAAEFAKRVVGDR